jgi:hypothetical protein
MASQFDLYAAWMYGRGAYATLPVPPDDEGKMAQRISAELCVVIANAGVMATPFGHTADGFESKLPSPARFYDSPQVSRSYDRLKAALAKA